MRIDLHYTPRTVRNQRLCGLRDKTQGKNAFGSRFTKVNRVSAFKKTVKKKQKNCTAGIYKDSAVIRLT